MTQVLPERSSTGRPARWEPLSELDQMTERMRRLLDQMTERMRRMLEQTLGRPDWPSFLTERAGWSPFVDVEELDDAYVLEVELPGSKREDIDIELVGNELTIAGEIKEPKRTGNVRHRTRRTGRFEYRASLPSQVDEDKVQARLADGVLTVRVPKAERAHRRRIEIGS